MSIRPGGSLSNGCQRPTEISARQWVIFKLTHYPALRPQFLNAGSRYFTDRPQRLHSAEYSSARQICIPCRASDLASTLRLFLPDEIIATRRTLLANVHRAACIYC